MKHPDRLIPERPFELARPRRWSPLATAVCLAAWSGPHLLAATQVVDLTLSFVLIIGTVTAITCCMANAGWWQVICADFLDIQAMPTRSFEAASPDVGTAVAWPLEPPASEALKRLIRPRPLSRALQSPKNGDRRSYDLP